ncbi:hypothetical protein [Burkholderia plantarii]|uniref:hypothetical protein n=1 Tax=Burkholderia plantarii TaxID=41899 RepID=UPI0018DD5876|nr:hypothetical protein [Burkholderia plantarii]MBI0327777.1 hypothetical protein [Burkholderia plantarii]
MQRNDRVRATAGDARQSTKLDGGEDAQRGRRTDAAAHRDAAAGRKEGRENKIMAGNIAAFPDACNRAARRAGDAQQNGGPQAAVAGNVM